MDMLRVAASEGHERLVAWLLSGGYIDPRDLTPKLQPVPGGRKSNPDPPLSCAAAGGHVGVVRLLLDHPSIDPNAGDENRKAPLCSAAENGHIAVVKLLLDHPSIDPNTSDKYGIPPLCRAAGNGHVAVVKLLLEQPAIELNVSDKHGRTSLYYAARAGHEAVVRLLLERDDVDPNAACTYGFSKTPLTGAVREGHLRMVKLLLAKGADPQHPADGLSPLYWAASEGHEDILRFLLTLDRVDPNAGDDTGRTPLWIATVNGQTLMADLIRADRRFDPAREG
jgi:ankyrin repeat protein